MFVMCPGVAKIDPIHLLTNGSQTDAASYATASYTPSPNRLVLAAVFAKALAAESAVEPTASGNGITWVVVNSLNFGPSSGLRLTLFRGLVAAPSVGATTFAFGAQTQDLCRWSISEFANVNTSGSNGSGAIGDQNAASQASATGVEVDMAPSAGDPDWAMPDGDIGYAASCVNANEPIIPFPTGYTELGEVGTPGGAIQTMYTAVDEPLDPSVAGDDATARAWAMIACEIKHAA